MKLIHTLNMLVARNFFLVLGLWLISGLAATSGQTNPRDFGPPYGQGRPVSVVVVRPFAQPLTAPTVANVVTTAYAPVAPIQVAYDGSTPTACGQLTAPVWAARPVPDSPVRYGVPGSYTVNYAPAAVPVWQSPATDLRAGQTIYGSPTIYGNGQPLRNVVRSVVP